jgi:flagellar biogenesis protein FliO
LFFSAMLGFVALAQAPGQPAKTTPSEQELQGAYQIGDDGVNPQTQIEEKAPSAWRAFGSLVFVLGIAGGGIWALRKWGIKRLPGSGGNRMKIEETLALGERRFVSILKVDDERFLIASSPQGVGLIARLDGSVEPGFEHELEQHIQVQSPIPVKDMEAKLKGEQP